MKQPLSANGYRSRVALGVVGVALSAMLAAQPAAAETGRVRYVTDGDTFRLESGERIRIAGIDAPEVHADQAKCALEIRLGLAASAVARRLLDGRLVAFDRVGRSYNRTVARVRVDGRDLAATRRRGRGAAVATAVAQARLVPSVVTAVQQKEAGKRCR